MPFKKMEPLKYPPRLWALVGFPGSGKSTFATQMRGPLLAIDADQRFGEVLGLTGQPVYALSAVAVDNTDPERVAQLLEENMPGSGIKTIVVDSLTTIIAPLVTKAVIDNDAGRNKNKMAAFKDKALTMRLLQDSATKWGCDVLWIYHLQEGRDAQANQQTAATISRTERARLLRSLNLKLEVVQEDARRGIKVTWARRGRAYPAAPVLWDETGTWAGMPEKIEAAVYDGLSQQERDAIEQQVPATFKTDEDAIAWGFEQGAFQALQHARNAYDKLKAELHPQNAEEVTALWVANVEYRLAEAQEADPADEPAPGAVLDEFFPREDTPATNTPPTPKTAPEPPTPSKATDSTAFWTQFYAMKAQGKLPNADRLKTAPEIKAAQASGDWETAMKWLRTQVRD
ncbi:MAG TPA: AAA family ATPase [Anaerolineae bacterium]|nr:AAA family ATPase [Anaerolineae bacterium]